MRTHTVFFLFFCFYWRVPIYSDEAHMRTHKFTHTQIYTRIHIYTRARTHMRHSQKSARAHTHTHKFTHACAHTNLHTHTHLYTRAHTHATQSKKRAHTHKFTHAYTFIHARTHTCDTVKKARAHTHAKLVRYTLGTLTQAKHPCAHTCETGSSGTVVNDDGVCHWECVLPFESSNVACMICIYPLMGNVFSLYTLNVFSLYTLSWDPPTTQAKHSVC